MEENQTIAGYLEEKLGEEWIHETREQTLRDYEIDSDLGSTCKEVINATVYCIERLENRYPKLMEEGSPTRGDFIFSLRNNAEQLCYYFCTR